MDSRPADGSKSILSAKRWFKARNGTLTVVRIQKTYTRVSGQTMVQKCPNDPSSHKRFRRLVGGV